MNIAVDDVMSGPSPRFWSRFNSALVVALIAAVVGWGFQLHLTRQASNQTFNLSRVAEFSTNGQALDKAIVAFFNTAAARQPLEQKRAAAEQAVTDHSIKVEALRDVFGAEASDEYLHALGRLNDVVSETADERNSDANITAFGRVLELRRRLVQNAKS